MYPASDNTEDEQNTYNTFNLRVGDLMDRLKGTNVTPASHA